MWNLKIPNTGQIDFVIIDWKFNSDSFTLVEITWTVILWSCEVHIIKVPIQ